MGVSANEFWAQSRNGKAMLVMLAQRGDVELVRDVCDWLVVTYEKDLIAGNLQRGATMEQAKIAAKNGTAAIQGAVQSISDRNVEGAVGQIVDAVFQRYYNAGKPTYDKAMGWFADELRKRVKDDNQP